MSRPQDYGVTDLGAAGISTFFARHRCNRYCQNHWQKPRDTTVHYSQTSGTTMELIDQQPAYGGIPFGVPVIYEDESDRYYDCDDDSDYY